MTSTSAATDSQPDNANPLTARRAHAPHAWELWVVLGLLGAWAALISRFGDGDVYRVMGPYACLVSAVCLALAPRALLRSLACDVRGLWLGLGTGVLMTGLTYPVYELSVGLFPSLEGQVQSLYRGARATSLGRALVWVAALVIAEEVLFRGVLPRALTRITAQRTALTVSIFAYALAQLGSGSWIVFALALVCGVLWTVLRVHTQSLTPALIAHGIWTPIVILLVPVA